MKKLDQLILVVGIILTVVGVQYLEKDTVIPKSSPDIPLVVPDITPPNPPEPKVPDLVTNIIYDDCDEALRLSKIHKKPLILIFGASWCQYCQELKKDIPSIQELNKAIVCVLNIEKHKSLVSKYKVTGLPTSIIITNNKEHSRKSGYKNSDYKTWLGGNL